jgi:DNA repair protein RAD5
VDLRYANIVARIGIKPLRSNAIATAQKKNGKIVIDEKSLKLFKDAKQAVASRSVSPVLQGSRASSQGQSSVGKIKGKGKANVPDEDDDGSGDEAEKLNDDQMNELEAIYHK